MAKYSNRDLVKATKDFTCDKVRVKKGDPGTVTLVGRKYSVYWEIQGVTILHDNAKLFDKA